MTKDLEETLAMLDPGCRDVVARLVAGRHPETSTDDGLESRFGNHARRKNAALLAAASIALVLGWFSLRTVLDNGTQCLDSPPRRYTLAYAKSHLGEIISQQNADGGWGSDFLTRQNAAALALAGDSAGRLAYKKAMRHLRLKGLRPLSKGEYAAYERRLHGL